MQPCMGAGYGQIFMKMKNNFTSKIERLEKYPRY